MIGRLLGLEGLREASDWPFFVRDQNSKASGAPEAFVVKGNCQRQSLQV